MQVPDNHNAVSATQSRATKATKPSSQQQQQQQGSPVPGVVEISSGGVIPGKSGVRLSSPRAAAALAETSRRPGRPSLVPSTSTRQQQHPGNLIPVDGPAVEDDDEEEEAGAAAAAAGSNASTNRPVAWQCGACSYCILAMDQHGAPLPITNDAWGNPLPLQCPRCLQVHDSWSLQTPFDEYGEHVNVKGCFSNSVHRHLAPPSSSPVPPSSNGAPRPRNEPPLREVATIAKRSSDAHLLENLPPVLASIGLVTYRDGVAVSTMRPPSPKRVVRQAYYCALCNRKLLRMDQYGAMVPLDVDGDGRPLPLMCPGCKNTHSDWPIRTF